MKKFNYNPIINGKIINNVKEQHETFFYQGHPLFLIPDFSDSPEEIIFSYLNYLDKKYKTEVYDCGGGEVINYQIIDESTGLTKVLYQLSDVQIHENDEYQDIDIEIEGFVVEEKSLEEDFYEYIFVATSVFEQSKPNLREKLDNLLNR